MVQSGPKHRALALGLLITGLILALPSEAGAAVIVSGNGFRDSDGKLLENHAGRTNARWSRHRIHAFRVRGGRIWGRTPALYTASGAPPSNDYDVSARLHVKSNVGLTGIVGRSSANGGMFYLARYAAATKRWELIKCVASGCRLLGSSSQRLAPRSTHRLRLGMRDGAKTLYVDGRLRVSSPDNQITQIGRGGVSHSGASASPTAGYHLDDFGVSVPGTTLWEATAESGDFSEWDGVQVANPWQAFTSTSPSFAGRRAFGLTVKTGDHVACDGGCDRAQANGPYVHQEGETDYSAVAIYVPNTYPASSTPNHFQTTWQWHGEPYGYSPPLEIGIVGDATRLDVSHNWFPGKNGVRSGPQTYDDLTDIPLVKGRWLKFVWRVKWSRWDNQGFVELWYAPHGRPLVKQTFYGGSQREYGATLGADMTRGIAPRADNYRRTGSPNATTTLYFDAVRTATSLDGAAAAFGDPGSP